jgi:hypothetical protein
MSLNVYEAEFSEETRAVAAGVWQMEDGTPVLVFQEYVEDGDGWFVQAVALEDYDIVPGFTIVDVIDATKLGTARVRVHDSAWPDRQSLLGQLYVRGGKAVITYLSGMNEICLAPVRLAEVVNDGDYGFGWSIEVKSTRGRWKKCYDAASYKSWLNEWRPVKIPAFWEELPFIDIDTREGLLCGCMYKSDCTHAKHERAD